MVLKLQAFKAHVVFKRSPGLNNQIQLRIIIPKENIRLSSIISYILLRG